MRPIPHRDEDEPESVDPPITRVPEERENGGEEADDDESWLEAQEF